MSNKDLLKQRSQQDFQESLDKYQKQIEGHLTTELDIKEALNLVKIIDNTGLNYTCSMCKCLHYVPQTLACIVCQRRFCHDCIQSKELKEECPQCLAKPFKLRKLSDFEQQIINSIQTEGCPFPSCKFRAKILCQDSFIQHLKEDCEGALFQCPLNCNMLVSKQSKDTHFKRDAIKSIVQASQMCPNFLVTCTSCNEDLSEAENSSHGCSKRWEVIAQTLHDEVQNLQKQLQSSKNQIRKLELDALSYRAKEQSETYESNSQELYYEEVSKDQYGSESSIYNRYGRSSYDPNESDGYPDY
ncbi:hypothetical protein FGO68_gene9722 [Halteria grandinella]|uniref:RING-type domain-containing protein n=1 Tax=Halteria grandinella TaxID=5974 RepID=A0A8J8NM53_HALGN|nr:hypothetical protein FGO68_gene9722 [Halteria grandinella]